MLPLGQDHEPTQARIYCQFTFPRWSRRQYPLKCPVLEMAPRGESHQIRYASERLATAFGPWRDVFEMDFMPHFLRCLARASRPDWHTAKPSGVDAFGVTP